ncbi:flagellar motor control protein ZomB [Corynebacterium auris]|uniref:flagellar motor control protein ZomB n=1 Tax=Corynebacterium auris TaxID=44750 RepID=UPI0025B342C2|nr:flagellar motor control protein ZomB [Corynebacterium auris]WJY68971.1 hypothetical protein CAURIS_10500 [Corynebacterium auris]
MTPTGAFQKARLSLLLAAVAAGLFALVGGWQRRWMSDDGLIVLRTVRNLLEGNGPVFNAGERVEANTSTLWQYLITAFGWLTGARLESIALWLSLLLSVAAAVVATLASGRYWGTATVVLPFGVILYFALPPARDFTTSGLEWGLSLFWIAVWWALLVAWAVPGGRRAKAPVGYWLAFWAGLSWLVRPELALYGGITGLVLLAHNPRRAPGILAAALPVPAAYQIFRMGYYGLLTPHTAVAKSASDAEWAQGAEYAWDFLAPYALWAPLLVAVAIGVWLVSDAHGRALTIAALVVGCALLHALYVTRVGGDFMHGRMLLLPLFAVLLPLMAVPARPTIAAAVAASVVWAGVVIVRAHPLPDDIDERPADELGVVDEREFWTMAVQREPGDPPLYAEDFLDSKLMRTWNEVLAEAHANDAGQMIVARTSAEPEAFAWFYRPRFPAQGSDLEHQPLTIYFINLGMTGMNAGLDVRVLETVGLATPLAARMPRDPEGRVGHDKHLPVEWQVADSGTDLDGLPEWIDAETARQARAALRTPEIAELLASSREPMSVKRFLDNMRYAFQGGRTLELSDDPSVYLDEDTLRRIADGEDVGREGPRVAWPRNTE